MASKTTDEQAIVNKLLALSVGIKAKSQDILELLFLPNSGITQTRIAQ
jgi:hypothetical protein